MTRDTITLRDVYDIVGRLENKLDERYERLEVRTSKLENDRSRAIGVISVLTIFVSGLATFIWDKILGRRL